MIWIKHYMELKKGLMMGQMGKMLTVTVRIQRRLEVRALKFNLSLSRMVSKDWHLR